MLLEKTSLKGLAGKITNHFFGRTKLNLEKVLSNAIGDEKIADVKVSCALA